MPVITALTREGLEEDLAATVAELDRRGFATAKRGIVGFCMGGAVALFADAQGLVGAAVTFYGGGVTTGRFGLPPLVELAPSLTAPWLGLYGDLDQGIPVDQVEALRAAAATASTPTSVVRYEGAGHGFNCDARPDYVAADADDAWARTLSWFEVSLG
jgi:carboxymethylenebutenolidase